MVAKKNIRPNSCNLSKIFASKLKESNRRLLRELDKTYTKANAIKGLQQELASVCFQSFYEINYVINTYGVLSKAAYIVKYYKAAKLFSLLMRCKSSACIYEEVTILKDIFNIMLENISIQFYAMSDTEHDIKVAETSIKCTSGKQNYVNYNFSSQIYDEKLRADGNKIQSKIIRVDKLNLSSIYGNSQYLYCVAKNGDLLLYNKPMTFHDFVAGVSDEGVIVKHPMLVQRHDLGVRCAGDILIVKILKNDVAGVMVSLASGHYRPGIESISSIKEMGRDIFGLQDDGDIAVIGDLYFTRS